MDFDDEIEAPDEVVTGLSAFLADDDWEIDMLTPDFEFRMWSETGRRLVGMDGRVVRTST